MSGSTAEEHAGSPRHVRHIRTRFESRCYWCGEHVPSETDAVYYQDEKEAAHTACHEEVCGR
jgi:hypothetical protein